MAAHPAATLAAGDNSVNPPFARTSLDCLVGIRVIPTHPPTCVSLQEEPLEKFFAVVANMVLNELDTRATTRKEANSHA